MWCYVYLHGVVCGGMHMEEGLCGFAMESTVKLVKLQKMASPGSGQLVHLILLLCRVLYSLDHLDVPAITSTRIMFKVGVLEIAANTFHYFLLLHTKIFISLIFFFMMTHTCSIWHQTTFDCAIN